MIRLIDFVSALIAVIFLSPIILVVAFLLYVFQKRQVFFRQLRPGFHGEIFTIYKFKTMMDVFDSRGELLPDSERLTTIGRFVRMLSLDELPQLFNVLKGDMSLVGPRPLLPEYLPLYNDFQKRRHEVRPGITGWAQINGRNAITWDERFKLDVWFVDNYSVALYLKILCLTVFKVFKREGISEAGHVTMSKFRGNM